MQLTSRFMAPGVDYTATLDVALSSEGDLSISAVGVANGENYDIRRYGVCILLGAREYAGVNYRLRTNEGFAEGTFTDEVDRVIRPATFVRFAADLNVEEVLSTNFRDVLFGLENQRAFNDSSWKLFSGLDQAIRPFRRAKGDRARCRWPLGAFPRLNDSPFKPRVGRMPAGEVSRGIPGPAPVFSFADLTSAEATWGFAPLVNQDDDDTVAENVTAVMLLLVVNSRFGSRFSRGR